MNVSSLIDAAVTHAHDGALEGKIVDLLFDLPLTRAEFVLVDVTDEVGTAPLLLTADAVDLVEAVIKLRGDPDDTRKRLQASIADTTPLIDLTHLPHIVIGPFGNAISPSMLAALFNRRQGRDLTALPEGGTSAVWFSELRDLPIDFHISRAGRIEDVVLHTHSTEVSHIACQSTDGGSFALRTAELTVSRNAQAALIATASVSA